MKLSTLIENLPVQIPDSVSDVEILSVVDDSRQASMGSLFIARTGSAKNGSAFIRDAVQNGAIAVLTDSTTSASDYISIQCSNPADIARPIAQRFNEHPESNLKLIGVTGTNGKTTTAYFIRHLLNAADMKCGMIGTIEIDDGGKVHTAELTTPGTVQLLSILRRMVVNNCKACVMEVSSHALDQDRVDPGQFSMGVFTNLSGDHLDYHGSMENYTEAKAGFFDRLQSDSIAVVNGDDIASRRMTQKTPARTVHYSLGETGDIRAIIQDATPRQTQSTLVGPWGSLDISYPLIGRHNTQNLLSAITAVHALGVDVLSLKSAIEKLEPVPGRLQPLVSPASHFSFDVFVDYAHTDDALENVLKTLRPLASGQLRVLFGCGGDRDRSKRSRMASVSETYADRVVVTSDNPRTEDPQAIINDVVSGFSKDFMTRVNVEPDRQKAIDVILSSGESGDIILIAGKGHEDYQIIGTEKHPFDDRRIAQRILKQKMTPTA